MNFYGGNKSKGDILVIFGAKIEMHFKKRDPIESSSGCSFHSLIIELFNPIFNFFNILFLVSLLKGFYFLGLLPSKLKM